MTTQFFLRQVPLNPRERLARATKNKTKQSADDANFIKKVPLRPRKILRKETKKLTHPRDRIKNKELKIARTMFLSWEGKI